MKNYLLLFMIKIILHDYFVAAVDLSALRCSVINNDTCELDIITDYKIELSSSESNDLGIVQLFPYHLVNVKMAVLDFLDITLVEGYAYGIDTCRHLEYKTNITDFYKSVKTVCQRIEINGTYSLSTRNGIFGNITGRGTGSIVACNWRYNFTFPFDFEKKSDDEIYTVPYYNEAEYTSEIWTKATVNADCILVNGHDATKDVLSFINKNWRIIFHSFLGNFHEMVMQYFFGPYKILYSMISATKMFTDDLNPYVKKNLTCQ